MNKEEGLLLRELRESGSKNADLFYNNSTTISYKTGIPVLDYFLGYRVDVYNEDDELTDSYSALGITGGSYALFIGKPSTSKTSTAVSIAANIIRDYPESFIVHFDLEQAMNYTRIKTLTRMKMTKLKRKYVLRQEKTTLEDMKKSIIEIYMKKTRDPKTYKYKTGVKDEFGQEIEAYYPTVIILDSIATISMGLNENDKKELAELEKVASQTDRMRLTGEIGRFFTDILPYLRTANIILIAINQIKINPQMGIVKSPAEILYLKQDEALPGGRAPQFYAHILLKFVAVGSEKYTEEENGFDGFGVRAEIIKSRTNQAGQVVPLVYDKVRGVDSLRSTINFAKEAGLTGGNKNSFYFTSDKDRKFSLVHVHEAFKEDPSLFKLMYDTVIPVLQGRLSAVEEDENDVIEGEFDY